MKVLIDTNVVLDGLMERSPWVREAEQLIRLMMNRRLSGFISASSLTDIAYLSYRISKDRHLQRKILNKCVGLFQIITINQALIEDALALNGPDFEDDLQIIAAVSAGCDVIVTRDTGGFLHSPLPVYDPIAFLKRI